MRHIGTFVGVGIGIVLVPVVIASLTRLGDKSAVLPDPSMIVGSITPLVALLMIATLIIALILAIARMVR